ncbi:MAG: hypothetical protein WBG50_12620 [Desulfomonilaceae bacterium]
MSLDITAEEIKAIYEYNGQNAGNQEGLMGSTKGRADRKSLEG